MKTYCVYVHTAPNNKRYVGQTCQKIEARFKDGKGYCNNPHFFSAILRYGWESFSTEIIKEGLSAEEADLLEVELIHKYNTTDSYFGYNLQIGGHGPHTHSESTRNKISNSMQNRKREFTSEHKDNISKAKKGKCSEKQKETAISNLNSFVRDEEYKKKMSESKKGKPGRVWTEEQKLKLSNSRKKVYSAI